MSRFTLRQLECFAAVVETGSLTAAARRVNASVSAVSLSLRDLESALRVPLTVRHRGRGTSLTPAGRLAYQRACAVLDRSQALDGLASEVRGELSGDLRLGCFGTLSPWLVPRIISHIAERHPSVEVHLQEGDSAELQQQLGDGELDAVLMYRNALAHDVSATEIAPVRLQIVLAANHPLASSEAIPLAALRGEPAILVGLPAATAHVEAILRAAGLDPNVRWRSTNAETIRSMVARGLGYSIIMGRPQGDRTYEGLSLAYRRIQDDVPANAVVIAHPEPASMSAKLRMLVAFCLREFALEGRPVQ